MQAVVILNQKVLLNYELKLVVCSLMGYFLGISRVTFPLVFDQTLSAFFWFSSRIRHPTYPTSIFQSRPTAGRPCKHRIIIYNIIQYYTMNFTIVIYTIYIYIYIYMCVCTVCVHYIIYILHIWYKWQWCGPVCLSKAGALPSFAADPLTLVAATQTSIEVGMGCQEEAEIRGIMSWWWNVMVSNRWPMIIFFGIIVTYHELIGDELNDSA